MTTASDANRKSEASPERRSSGASLLPAEVFRRFANRTGVVFLDGRFALTRAPFSHLAWNPRRELRIESSGAIQVDGARAVDRDALPAMDEFLRIESRAGRTVFGVLAYELGAWIEPRVPRRASDFPLAVLRSYEDVLTYDHRNSLWSAAPPFASPPVSRFAVRDLRVSVAGPDYRRRFEKARDWIGAGDVYQVNLAIGFEGDLVGDPAALYEAWASAHPVPYGAYVDCGDFRVLSNSPELFLARRGDSLATRPIKGTRQRGDTVAEDDALRNELSRDAKERAEHVMIVDLERNDLGRLAERGTVRVTEFECVERYATLHHLESTIAAQLRPGLRFSEILRATFPGGSITGAPKVRAMQIIGVLELESRDVYTGAILHHPPDGDFTMSLAIRTAVVRGGRIRYGVGSGLVWDSVADREYRECLLKAQAFFEAARAV